MIPKASVCTVEIYSIALKIVKSSSETLRLSCTFTMLAMLYLFNNLLFLIYLTTMQEVLTDQ